MIYILVVAFALAIAFYFGNKAVKANREEIMMAEKVAPRMEQMEKLESLNLDHKVLDVKEKVVESEQTLREREQNLASKEVVDVEPDVNVTNNEEA